MTRVFQFPPGVPSLWRRATVAVAVLLLGWQPVGAFARAPPSSVLLSKPAHYSFAFAEADVAQVAEEVLSHTLGLNYTVDTGVMGKVSFRIDRQLTPIQLLEAFEAALEPIDVVMVRDGDSFVLRTRARAKALAGLGSAGAGSSARGPGYGTVSVPLSYATPSEVAKTLQAMSATDPVVLADDRQGLLVLGGAGQALESMVELAKSFDRSGLEGSKIRYFELSTAPAGTVATELEKVLAAAALGGAKVIPLKRLNALLVFARTTQALDEVSNWVARLDVPSKEKTTTLFVYRPRNVAADALGATLSSVIFGQASGSNGGASGPQGSGASAATGGSAAPQGSFVSAESAAAEGMLDGDPARLGVNKESNTLLVFTTPTRWIQIQRVLDEIDRPPGQVMIEASILEVTLTNQESLGVDWTKIAENGRLTLSSINSGAATIASTVPGLSVTYLTGDVKAAISALGEQGQVEVVSAPKVLALENHPARLDVGDQVPIVTQSGQSTSSAGSPIINSVDYRDTGIILKVTPHIVADSRISLEVDQEVSSVARTTSSGINSPTIQQRKIMTSLSMDDGHSVALGGLISSGRQYTDTGIPILKDVPIVGHLFKTSTVSHNRTELIVLLTAHIATDPAASQRITRDVLADMKEVERRGLLRP